MIVRKPEILLCFGLCLVTKRPLWLAAKSPTATYSPGSPVSHSFPGVGNGATTVKRTGRNYLMQNTREGWAFVGPSYVLVGEARSACIRCCMYREICNGARAGR